MDSIVSTMQNGKPIPVAFQGVTNATADNVKANLVATFDRGYSQRYDDIIGSIKGGAVSIVGSGPSLRWTYKDLAGDVFACNSAHDFLIEHGIVPKWAMFWDANQIISKFATKPHKGVKYLVASRCHPDVFAALEGYDVTVWHAAGDPVVEELLNERKIHEAMIGGGCAGVTRALFVAGALGYNVMHLFGVDSCYSEGKTHVNGSVIDQQAMPMRICGKWFTIAPWMALQVGDMNLLVPQMQKNGVRFVVHGHGLIPHVATFMNCETPDIEIRFLEKIRRRIDAVRYVFSEVKNSPQLLGGS